MNVYQKIQAVMGGLPYIQKKKSMSVGTSTIKTLSYEDLAAEVQPLLVKHGLVVESNLLRQTTEIHESEKPAFKAGDPPKKVLTTIATVEMAFRFINVEDPTDATPPMTFPGMGFDTSDKAMGKATTYAAKDFYRKVFVVPSGEEPEDDNHERPGKASARAADAAQDADRAAFPPEGSIGRKPAQAVAPAHPDEEPWLRPLVQAARDKVGKQEADAMLRKCGFRGEMGGPSYGLSEAGLTALKAKLTELVESKK